MVRYTCEDDSPEIKVSVEGTEEQLAYQIWMLIDDVSDVIQNHSPEEAEDFLNILESLVNQKSETRKRRPNDEPEYANI